MSGEATPTVTAAAGDAAENVQVVVRVRPLNKGEKERGEKRVVDCVGDRNEIVVPTSLKSGLPRKFTFDRVYDVASTQESLFNTSVAPVVDEVLAGYSCTVFAYGQTGTGKTYTMEGKRDETGSIEVGVPGAGIIARAVARVFDSLSAYNGDNHVKISFLEIYNERLDDLLAPEPSAFMSDFKPVAKSGKERNLFGDGVSAPLAATATFNSTSAVGGALGMERLKIVEDKRQGIKVQNLEEIPVKSADEVFAYVNRGIAKRATAETACNAQSSRSHCVFTLTIHMRETVEGEDVIRIGKLNLVDLAGSECVGRSGAKDARAREAGNINQSLLTLGRVITALVDHLPHIPYRDSKLTRLLQDSLGGRTKTCIIATLSPAASCFEESLSTLEYANRAKNIRNRPEANARMEKRALITAYAGEIETLKLRLAAQIAKEGVFLPQEEYEGMLAKTRQLEYEIEELSSLKVANEEEIGALKSQLGDLREALDAMTEKYLSTHAQLVSTTEDLVATQDNLSREKIAHDESRVVMRAHAATETALTAQATAVMGTLKDTVGDVKGLHAKVERTNSVLAFNKRSGDVFAQASAVRMTQLVSSTNDFASAHSEQLGMLNNSTSMLAERHSAGTESALQALQKMKSTVAQYTKSTSSSAASLESDVLKAVTSLQSNAHTSTGKCVQDVALLEHAMTASIEQVQQALVEQAGMMQSWLEACYSTLQSAQDRVAMFASTHADALLEIRGAVGAHVASLNTKLQEQETLYNSMQETQNAATAKAAADLISNFSSMVQTFSKTQQQATTQAVAEAMSGIRVMQKSSQQFIAVAEDKFSGISGIVESFSENCVTDGEQSRAAMRAHYTEVSGRGDAIQADLAHATTALQQQSSSLQTGLKEQCSSVTAGSEPLKTIAAAFASRAKSTAVGTAEGFNKDIEVAASIAKETQETTQAAIHEVNEHANTASTGVAKYCDASRQWVATESAAIHTFFTSTLRDTIATGATPAKKEYFAPGKLMATSPADRILERYRSAQQVGLPTPARDQAAFGKCLDLKAAVEDVSVVEGRESAHMPQDTTHLKKNTKMRSASLSEETNAALLALVSRSESPASTASTPSAYKADPPSAPTRFSTASSTSVSLAEMASVDDIQVPSDEDTTVTAAEVPSASPDIAEEKAAPAEAPIEPAPKLVAKPVRVSDSSDAGSVGSSDSATTASTATRGLVRTASAKTTLAARIGKATSAPSVPAAETENTASSVEATAVIAAKTTSRATSRSGTSSRLRAGVGPGPRQSSKLNTEA